MKNFDMLYNSEKGDITISEYGRNIQNLVGYAKTIEDYDHREAVIKEIINLISIMNPNYRAMVDYQEKLWNHLFRIANYDLDILIPEGVTIHRPEEVKFNPDMEYPHQQFKFRHYGSYIQVMIKKALLMEDPEKKRGFAQVIASYMKLAYQTWNKEHYVNDEIIKNDLFEMTNGQLSFEDDFSIENLISSKSFSNNYSNNNKRRPGSNNNNNNNYKRNNNNSGGGNNKGKYNAKANNNNPNYKKRVK